MLDDHRVKQYPHDVLSLRLNSTVKDNNTNEHSPNQTLQRTVFQRRFALLPAAR